MCKRLYSFVRDESLTLPLNSSVSTCRTPPSPCSSARSRRRETQPRRTVSCRRPRVDVLFGPPSDSASFPSSFPSGMTVEVMGAVLGTAIQGQIVGMANAPCIPGPGDPVPNATNLSVADGHPDPLFSPTLDYTVNGGSSRRSRRSLLKDEQRIWVFNLRVCHFVPSLKKNAYLIASGVICLIYVLCAFVLFFGVREQEGKSPGGRDIPVSVPASRLILASPLSFQSTAAPGPCLSSRASGW